MMSWHRAAVRKVRGVGHAIASLVDQQGDQTAPKRCPESPVTPIRPAPWRRFLSHTAIDAACAAPALSQARSESQKKQNNGPNCNFFAIKDCCVTPDRGLGPENAGNQPQKDPFPLCGDGNESVIAKKLQKSRDFCFHTRGIAATRRILRKTCRIPATKKTGEKRTDTAAGQITHKTHETQPRRWGWVS